MDLMQLANSLFGRSRSESDGLPSATVELIAAEGATDSADGNAGITLDADITPPDDYDGDESILDVPTSPSVKAGDDVLVALAGSGPLKTPVVLANPGFGDRLQSQMDITEELVERAEEAARATSQHFWHDDNGAHVTQVTQDEWNDSTSASYQSGPNSLWNSLGMLFRDGLTNLLAVLTTGIAIYDGNGNAAANILAEFTANLVRIGGRFATSGQSSAGVQFFADDSSTSDLTASHYIDTEQDMQVYHNLMLDGTTTDQMLTGGTVTHSASGNLATYQEVYNDGTNWSEESDTGITAKTGDAQQVAKMGVNALRSSAGTKTRRAYVQADELRLTYGTGSSASVNTFDMSDVVQQLTCVPISHGGTGQTTADTAARALGLAKTKGDSWSMPNVTSMGFVNNGRTTVNMFVPIPFRIYGSPTVNVTGTVRIRQYNGTFLLGSTNATAVDLASLVRSKAINANGYILLNLGNGSAMTNATANAACVVQFADFNITLS